MAIDSERIDLVLKFALATAGREEYESRELGPIHLVKYVYLGDLGYSEVHAGTTYTGISWRFHHFGPWAEEIFLRIKPVVEELGATERKVGSPKYADDFYRWSVNDDALYEKLYALLPLPVSTSVKSAIHAFGNNTAELLHHVYRTRPVLKAAPGELLSFDSPKRASEPTESQRQESSPKAGAPLTVRQRNQRKEALRKLRETVETRLERSIAEKKRHMNYTPPRYDQVYFEGLEVLDRLAGAPIGEESGVIEVTKEMWKSPFRTEDEIP
jgi:hypothetical protein